ncbi:MAG TPA: lactate racemase domain-containing protein [Anaerolineaceae bacterium]|nr:lactate racemase domain-containing protein [Anaerolineaceae bacterium]HPN53511.1 lactate racemase domain-containing protein [Anaerolineaceae bacterium]
MLQAQITSPAGQVLPQETIRATLAQTLEGQFSGQRILVLIPDHTRSLPLPFLFRCLVESLKDARQLDFMVALGTHPALDDDHLNQLVGVSPDERAALAVGKGFGQGHYPSVQLLNHAWDNPAALTSLGVIEQDQIREIAGSHWHASLPEKVDICINRAILNYDHLIILGPTFPHEVVGFSGGVKYLFPGISGPEMINATHWLGALAGVVGTIGLKDTPARGMIHAAAAHLPRPLTLIALVVEGHDLSGLFIGDHLSAWSAAADVSAQRHIRWCEKPFQRVLSCAPTMYDELWTAAKAMYKLEPVVAPGGEVIIYAPHLSVVSHVHGKYIAEIGYHILPYFLNDWERFKHIPLGVLAHSTHVRGSGHMENGQEKPNLRVTLASQIPPEECARLNLGYLDPASVYAAAWKDREEEGLLYVPKAGEILFRFRR